MQPEQLEFLTTEYVRQSLKMLRTATLLRARKIRPATAFPFTLGVFSGTLIVTFLCLALRSMDEENGTVVVVREPGSRQEVIGALPAEYTEEKKRQHQVAPSPRKMVSYNVITSREELKSRALAIHRTWGSRLKSSIDFYLFPPGGDEEFDFAYKRRMPIVSLGTKKRFDSSRSRDNQQGVFRTWKDICAKKAESYKWFIKVEDSVYVRTKELEKLFSGLNSSEPLLLGHSVAPSGFERDELGLRDGESYCLEMAYAVSWKALELVCPVLQKCQENPRSDKEDVEVARCFRNYVGINCTGSKEMKELFYKAKGIIAEEELQLGEHRLNPSVKTAILLSPLQEPEHFYHLHQHYSSKELNSTKVAATRMRVHMIQTAERGTQSDSFLHTNEHQSPPWTKLGVNPPYLPSEVEDLIHWQALDNQYRYTEAKFYPSYPISSLVKGNMNEVFKVVLHTPANESVMVDSVFQRVDPQRGVDYFLHTIEKDSADQYHAKFLHALREVEPVQITSLSEATYKTTKVNFVVPTPSVSRAFQRFMISFENSFLARKPPELVGLLVILYSDGKFRNYDRDIFAAISLLDLYKKKYPAADLRIISTRRPYSRKETVELASKEYPTYELLFLADIHIDFSPQFLERCRMNALESQQVYFPAVFGPYNPAEFYRSRIMFPYAIRFDVGEKKGSWMHESFHLLCVYNYDLAKVLELGKDLKESKWDLLDLFITDRRLRIFRAVEPGLVHLWQDGCKEEELGTKEKKLCNQFLDSAIG